MMAIRRADAIALNALTIAGVSFFGGPAAHAPAFLLVVVLCSGLMVGTRGGVASLLLVLLLLTPTALRSQCGPRQTVEGFQNAQNAGEVGRIVHRPIPLWGQPDARAIGTAPHVRATIGCSRGPSRRHQFRNFQTGIDDRFLQRSGADKRRILWSLLF